MKLLLFCRATVVMAAAGAYAAENGPIRICVQHRGLVNNFVMARAQTVVNSVFSDAGIQLEWLPSRRCVNAPDNVINIEMDGDSPIPLWAGNDGLRHAVSCDGSHDPCLL